MNNLHICLNNFAFASRVLKETQSIVKNGIAEKVFIAALHNEGLEEHKAISKSVELKRFKLWTRKLSKTFFLQCIKYIEFFIRIFLFYRKKKITMVNVHTLLLLPLGVILRYAFGAKLIYDAHELETEIVHLKGIKKKIYKLIERLFIKQSDLVIVVSEPIANWYEKTYHIPRPIVVLNAPKYQKVVTSNKFREIFKIRADQTIFLYQGGLKGRNIAIILEAFKRLGKDTSVMIFMGYGEMEDAIKQAANYYKNIYFHKPVPMESLMTYTSSANFGFTYLGNYHYLSGLFCMPNKLLEYIMAGIPVMTSSNLPSMANFVKQHKVGFVVEDSNAPEAIIELVQKLEKLNVDELKRNALEVAKIYNWEHQEETMIAAYRQMIAQ